MQPLEILRGLMSPKGPKGTKRSKKQITRTYISQAKVKMQQQQQKHFLKTISGHTFITFAYFSLFSNPPTHIISKIRPEIAYLQLLESGFIQLL